jgi:hypothetical protein
MRSIVLSLESKENLSSLHIFMSWIKITTYLKIVNQFHNAPKFNIGNNSKTKKLLETFALNEDETYSEGLYRFFSHGESLP